MIGDILRGGVDGRQFAEGTISIVAVLVRIGLVVLISAIISKLLSRIVDGLFKPRDDDQRHLFRDARRLMTLRTILKSVIRYAVYFIGGMMILAELGVNTTSLIAGAGIAGVALGFGAQNLVRDVITGFFILFEDQFAVGDRVTIAGISGIVEEIGLRVTRVRDFGGELHIVPNGSINLVTNFRGQSLRVMFDVQVPYGMQADRAIEILQRSLDEHRSEIPDIVEGPTVLGVQELGESGVLLRIWATAVPGQQWAVERALKLLIKESLDEHGIRVPYRHMVVLMGDDTPKGGESAGEAHRTEENTQW